MPANPDDSAPPESVPAAKGAGLFSNLRVVSLGTLTSRLLGLLRDLGMSWVFGMGTTLDAFVVAFRIPNLARQLFGEGALTTAFLPVFIRTREHRGDDVARGTLWGVAMALFLGLSAAVGIAELGLVAALQGMELTDSTQLLVKLLMIMLPYMVLICLSALLCAALYSLRQFLWPALVPAVLNIIWLGALAMAAFFLTSPLQQVLVISAAIPLAGLFQLAVPWWALRREGMGFSSSLNFAWPEVRDVFKTMFPVIGGLTILQINSVLDGMIAWTLARPDQGGPAPCEALGIPALLESGTAAALYLGQRMYQFPLGVFGVALGTVLYPVLTRHAQRGDMQGLREDLSRGLRIVIAVALPASVGLAILAEPLTALFRHGRFSEEDARVTARMIAVYGAGVWSYISMNILSRAFYAMGDRMTPMRFGMIALATNLALNVVFVLTIGGVGLALANVLASILQMLLSLRKLNGRIGTFDWPHLRRTALRGAAATLLMGLACLGVLSQLPNPVTGLTKAAALLVPCLVGIAVYWLAARLIGLTEIDELFA